MIRSYEDLYPVLAAQYALNRARIDRGDAPPIADLFSSADVVFAIWPGTTNQMRVRAIKGAHLLHAAIASGTPVVTWRVDVLPCRDKAEAEAARRQYGDQRH
jgi:hypothetical protein